MGTDVHFMNRKNAKKKTFQLQKFAMNISKPAGAVKKQDVRIILRKDDRKKTQYSIDLGVNVLITNFNVKICKRM